MWLRKRTDKDFQAEISSHLQLEADRLIAEGMSPAQARAAAQRAFGNVTLAQETFHFSRRWLWWEQLGQDLRYGLRALRKAPSFTAAVVLLIALGVGANTAIFSLMDAVLLRMLPVQDPKELVFLGAEGSRGTSGAPPYPCFARLRTEVTAFTGMSAFASDELRVEIDGNPEQVMGQVASGNYFQLLGVAAAMGRIMTPDDERLDPPIAVISHRYWRQRFGSDPAVIGKTITFRKQVHTIVGITPPEFLGLEPGRPIDLTIPISVERNAMASPRDWWFSAIARLKHGAAEQQALTEAEPIFQSFLTNESGLSADMIREHVHYLTLRPAAHGLGSLRKQFSRPLLALMGISGLVLLMATANIANMLLTRGISRSREFAIRLATGAARGRILRQLLTETLLLFVLGAVPGVLLAHSSVEIMGTLFAQGRRPIILGAEINWRVMAFTVVVTLVFGLAAALLPAWRAFRTSPGQAIKQGQARTGELNSSAILTRGLVISQVAVSLILLVAAVTFVRTLLNLRKVDPGFRNQQVLTMSVELPEGYQQNNHAVAFWTQLLDSIRGIAGVRNAGLAVLTPLSGRDRAGIVQVRGYQPVGFNDSLIHLNQISDGYFETLGIQLVRGRLFTGQDTKEALPVALINETSARKFFAERDPIGRTLEFMRNGTIDSSYQIVGVVKDTKHRDLREPVPPFAFLPIRQPRDSQRRLTLAVALVLPNSEQSLMRPIRSAIATINPGVLISEVITVQTQLDSTLLTERLLSGLSSAFGILALILAAVGLYGILSYQVGQQRRSIGIRMALGASSSSVALHVLRQCAFMVGVGILVGIPCAFLAASAAESMLWGVRSSDWMIYAVSGAILCLTALMSAYLPAQRASGIAPAEALRHE